MADPINKKDFDILLRNFKNLGAELQKHSYSPSQAQAARLDAEVKRYGKLSDDFEKYALTDEQRRELKGVRDAYRNDIRTLKSKLPQLISDQKIQAERMAAHVEAQQEKVEQAKSAIPELFEQINAAADDYLQATTQTMANDSLKTFKDLRTQLQDVLKALPKGEERTGYFKNLDSLSQKVNVQLTKNEKLLQEMRAHHQNQVKVNRKKVAQVVENGGSLVDVLFLTAPKEARRAVSMLIENKKVMDALKNNEQLLGLLGTDTVAEGLRQITSGNAEGAVVSISQQNQLAALETVLAELSKSEDISSKDIALARQFLGTVVSMVKGAQELQRGEKQYATFVTEVDGFVKVMHVNLNDFLIDPSTVGRILSTFMEQGVTQPLHMQLTSREQAAAISVVMNNVDPKALTGRMGSLSQEELLSLTQGSMSGALVKASTGELVTPVKTLADVTNLISQSAGNVDALARVLGTASPELAQQLAQVMNGLTSHYANKPVTTYTAEQTFQLITEFIVLSLTAQDIQRIINLPSGNPQRGAIGRFADNPLFASEPGNLLVLMDSSLANDSEGQSLLLGRVPAPLQLADSNTGPLHIMPPQDDNVEWGPFVGADPIVNVIPLPIDVIPGEQPAKKKDLDLTGHKENFNVLLNELAVICKVLAQKQEEQGEKYDAVMLEALNLHDTLAEAGEEFFAIKNPNLQQAADFKSLCTDVIESAEKEFKQHRGAWWDNSSFLGKLLAVTKAILGVVAAVTVLPALAVEGLTKHGYAKTFFTKPETESATKLAGVKAEFEEQTKEIDEAISEDNQKPISSM